MGRIEKLSLYRTATGLFHIKGKNKIATLKKNETINKPIFSLNDAGAEGI